jgi:ribonuclease HI
VQVHFDGACEPSRQGRVAAYGFTVEGGGLDHEEGGLAVRPGSERATNNVAEYSGAIRALEYLISREFHGPVLVVGDSQLVIRQMTGEYEVRAEHLLAYHDHLAGLARRFEQVTWTWVPREENVRADALSKMAAHAQAPVVRRGPAPPGEDDEDDDGPERPEGE